MLTHLIVSGGIDVYYFHFHGNPQCVQSSGNLPRRAGFEPMQSGSLVLPFHHYSIKLDDLEIVPYDSSIQWPPSSQSKQIMATLQNDSDITGFMY